MTEYSKTYSSNSGQCSGIHRHIIQFLVLVDTRHGLYDGFRILDGERSIGRVVSHTAAEERHRQLAVAAHEHEIV